MDIACSFPLFTILLCMISSPVCTLLKPRQAQHWTLCAETVMLGMSIGVLAYTLRTGAPFTYKLGEFPAPWGNELRAGPLEGLAACAFSGVLLCCVLGGADYVRIDIDDRKQNLFYALVNLASASLMALVWTNDLFTGYVFVEIMTLASCGMITARENGRTTLAAVRYMIMNLLGSGLFLLGVVLTYSLTGHLLMEPAHGEIAGIAAENGKVSLLFTITIMTVGLGIKSGMFPSYFWMPDTYGSATPTGAGILSSLVSKGYLFLLLKIYLRVAGNDIWQTMPLRWVLMALGLMGMIGGSVSALRSKSINRMTAYSSAAQIGYIYLGIGIGGTAGCTAAMFQILVHAVTKSLLFMTTPRLAAVSGESLLFERLRGSGRKAKAAGVFFTAAALSMVGVPFFAGFSVKLFFGIAAAEYGSPVILAAVMTVLGVSSILNALYFIRTVVLIYTGNRPGTKDAETNAENVTHGADHLPPGSARYYIAASALTIANLFLGLSAPSVVEVIRNGLAMFG